MLEDADVSIEPDYLIGGSDPKRGGAIAIEAGSGEELEEDGDAGDGSAGAIAGNDIANRLAGLSGRDDRDDGIFGCAEVEFFEEEVAGFFAGGEIRVSAIPIDGKGSSGKGGAGEIDAGLRGRADAGRDARAEESPGAIVEAITDVRLGVTEIDLECHWFTRLL